MTYITKWLTLGIASVFAVAPAVIKPEAVMAQVEAPAASTPETTEADSLSLADYSPDTAPLLTRGERGDVVSDVQAVLQDLGFYNGVIDGIYGPRTASSVITFQRSRNLTADGMVGDRTWEALIDAYNRTTPELTEAAVIEYSPDTAPQLAYGSVGPAVEALQAFLKDNGYYSGAIDGIYGSSTLAAVEAFQDGYVSLQPDGIVGENTWDAIIEVAQARG